jgi:methyl-accepting chemotaxis protein
VDSATECSHRLRALAAEPRFAGRRAELESIAEEVVDDDLDSWTGVDLVAAFPPDVSIEPPPRRHRERNLAALVGASVFAPVAWTWYSLHQASQAYLDLVDSDERVTDTFLTLWISGFDDRLGYMHRLVPVTVVSIVLIGLAALLVVAHRIVVASAEEEEEDHRRITGGRLLRELTTAQRILNGRRSDDPTRVESVVKRSVKELLAAHKATQASADELREASESVEEVLKALTVATGENRSAAVAAADAAKVLAQSGEDTGKAVDDALVRFLRGIDAHLHSLRQETSGVIARAAEAQREVTRELTALRQVGEHAGGDVKRSLQQVEQTVREVDASLARHESAMQGQASELTAARDALERMLREIAGVARDLSHVTNGIGRGRQA